MKYETVIGLEVHLQLGTGTKAFCGCSTVFGRRPNSQTCPVCLGLPGSLPVLNGEAFRSGIKVALALDCRIQKTVKFDRKNYYYPDLPKNFQISQYDMPLAYDGSIDIGTNKDSAAVKKIRIKRVHLEEDAGKLMHQENGRHSLIDYNRSGIPLLEIVTEPDMNSPQEAYEYLVKLKSVLEYLKVSDCDMEKGSLRCDANISVRSYGAAALGTKVELKNMNTFKGVRMALEYEANRQGEELEGGGKIVQETRLWNADKAVTYVMRSKEEAHDYRYFPEPDLVPFVIEDKAVDEIRLALPELPHSRRERFKKEYGLSEYDAEILTGQIDMAEYFEAAVKLYPNAKMIANWLMGDIMAHLNAKGLDIASVAMKPDGLAGLLKMIDDKTISGKMAKEVLFEAVDTGFTPADIVKKKGLSQITDVSKIEEATRAVIERETKSVNDYKAGKAAAFTFLVGQVMRQTHGKANPAAVNEVLKRLLAG